MKTKTRTLLIALASPLGVACHRSAPPPLSPYTPERGTLLTDSAAARLLRQCSRNVPSGLTGEWTPDRTQLDHLEGVLPAAIAAALSRVVYYRHESRPNAGDYYRQYAAVSRNGRRFIYVNGVHEHVIDHMGTALLRHAARSGSSMDSASAAAWWRQSPAVVCDGGVSSFGALYDVETGLVSDVEFNARATGRIELHPEPQVRPQN